MLTNEELAAQEQRRINTLTVSAAIIGAIMLYPIVPSIVDGLENLLSPSDTGSSQQVVEPAAGPHIVNDTKIQLSNNLSQAFGQAVNTPPALGSVKLVTIAPKAPSQLKPR